MQKTTMTTPRAYNDIPNELYYLRPNLSPSSLTRYQLKAILQSHHVPIPSSPSKPTLLSLYMDHIEANRDAILAKYKETHSQPVGDESMSSLPSSAGYNFRRKPKKETLQVTNKVVNKKAPDHKKRENKPRKAKNPSSSLERITDYLFPGSRKGQDKVIASWPVTPSPIPTESSGESEDPMATEEISEDLSHEAFDQDPESYEPFDAAFNHDSEPYEPLDSAFDQDHESYEPFDAAFYQDPESYEPLDESFDQAYVPFEISHDEFDQDSESSATPIDDNMSPEEPIFTDESGESDSQEAVMMTSPEDDIDDYAFNDDLSTDSYEDDDPFRDSPDDSIHQPSDASPPSSTHTLWNRILEKNPLNFRRPINQLDRLWQNGPQDDRQNVTLNDTADYLEHASDDDESYTGDDDDDLDDEEEYAAEPIPADEVAQLILDKDRDDAETQSAKQPIAREIIQAPTWKSLQMHRVRDYFSKAHRYLKSLLMFITVALTIFISFQIMLRKFNGYCNSPSFDKGAYETRKPTLLWPCIPCPPNARCKFGEMTCGSIFERRHCWYNRLGWLPVADQCVITGNAKDYISNTQRTIKDILIYHQTKSLYKQLLDHRDIPRAALVHAQKIEKKLVMDQVRRKCKIPDTIEKDVLNTSLSLLLNEPTYHYWEIDGRTYLGTDNTRFTWAARFRMFIARSSVRTVLLAVLMSIMTPVSIFYLLRTIREKKHQAKLNSQVEQIYDILTAQYRKHSENPTLYPEPGCGLWDLRDQVLGTHDRTSIMRDWERISKAVRKHPLIKQQFREVKGQPQEFWEIAT
ncbi:Man1-Src1p-C-terminal domain-containing protein [Radiomyces spectabilis]|uniref:Man1-Src1p-C-terminal domain-containing protein n=1 Tax=Radiomyces spectabilis TaxID=64574 RepID=UPI00221F8DC8|nr:Man1-Src1p-C-terminal domain-containing protein [Radiomyces spectabilis]KAI8376513.1 Man1-Src1p-C-terminal domain-containing protein [Radiomyces spectabilis]